MCPAVTIPAIRKTQSEYGNRNYTGLDYVKRYIYLNSIKVKRRDVSVFVYVQYGIKKQQQQNNKIRKGWGRGRINVTSRFSFSVRPIFSYTDPWRTKSFGRSGDTDEGGTEDNYFPQNKKKTSLSIANSVCVGVVFSGK